jgi:hypothetical protein
LNSVALVRPETIRSSRSVSCARGPTSARIEVVNLDGVLLRAREPLGLGGLKVAA